MIDRCQSPSTFKLLTLASWPRCGARSCRARWARPVLGKGLALHSQPAKPVDQRPQHFSLPPPGSAGRADTVRLRYRGHAHLKLPARCTRPETPPGEDAVTVHLGSYNRMNESHDEIRKWMAANRRESAGHSWEKR